MILNFDLQLFAGATQATITNGVTFSNDTFTIGAVGLSTFGASATVAATSWVAFKYNADAKTSLTFNAATNVVDSPAGLVAFAAPGTGNSWAITSAATYAFIGDSGKYTWKFADDQNIEKVTLGGTAHNIELNKFKSGLEFRINGKNSADSFTFSNANARKITINQNFKLDSKTMTLGNNVGQVSLLSGTSAVAAVGITAAVNGAIIIDGAMAKGGTGVLKLRGDNKLELKVTGITGALAGNVQDLKKITYVLGAGAASASLDAVKNSTVVVTDAAGNDTLTFDSIDGSSKVTFDGKLGNNTVSVGTVASGASVSLSGGTGNDTIKISAINGSDTKVTIHGGKGTNTINLTGTGKEILQMDSEKGAASASYITNNWFEYTGTEGKGNVISLQSSLKDDFKLYSLKQGVASVGAATETGTAAVLNSSDTSGYSKLGLNIVSSDGTNTALLVGGDSLASEANINYSKYDYIIGAEDNNTFKIGTSNKKVVFLANELGSTNWGDTNAYKGITKVVAATAGGSILINGVSDSQIGGASLVAAGTGDSLWGGNNAQADTLRANSAKSTQIFNTSNEGLDIVESYKAEGKSTDAVLHFIDGVGHMAVSEGNFVGGADSVNALKVSLDSSTVSGSDGALVAYNFGLDTNNTYLAVVDAKKTGAGTMQYNKDASIYIGQGDSAISVKAGTSGAKIGWDGAAGTVSIGAIDGTNGGDGAVLLGNNDKAQSITGASKGASSISGGFVREEWTNSTKDTLIGGGSDSYSTSFFVGQKMGSDTIEKLSSKDNVVFLGTKYADLTKALSWDKNDVSISFKFADATIDINTASGKKLSAIKDVNFYFDDGTWTWNGSDFVPQQ